MTTAPLGILGAMREEIDALWPHIERPKITERAGRRFVSGNLWGAPAVVVFSRWGKVAAASTATELIVAHGISRLVFSGIAGGLDHAVGVGDIVVARRLFQHDLDASPFFPPTEIPLLGVSGIAADETLSAALLAAADDFLEHDRDAAVRAAMGQAVLDQLGPRTPAAIRADIASGDQVVFTAQAKAAVRRRVPTAVAVEMEGAAVAQVCLEHAVPFACVRAISDSAQEGAHHEVAPFFAGLAGVYTVGVLERWLGGAR